MVKFKDFSKPLSVSQVLFKANLIFKDCSRQSYIYSSSFQACAKPVKSVVLLLACQKKVFLTVLLI